MVEEIKLTKEQTDILKSLDSNIKVVEKELRKMTALGIDTAEQRKKFEENKKLRIQLLAVYGG